MDFKNLKIAIDERLEAILQDELLKNQKHQIIINNIQDFLRLSKGGKRIRGILVILGSELMGKEYSEAIDLAVSVELMQTAILIHDDIIDHAEKRRGEPTINYKYATLGMEKAICVGDYGFFLTYQIINKLNIPLDVKNHINSIMTNMMYNTVLGEILDVEMPLAKNQKQSDLDAIYIYKTAWYTTIGPLLMGAALNKVDSELEQAIIDFGTNLGIAFQIKDDIISISDQYEKSSDSDILEGKITEMYLYTKQIKKQEIIGYGNPLITKEQIQQIKTQFKENGAIEYAEKKVDYFSKKALDHLVDMKISSDTKNHLINLVNILLTRKK